MDVMIDIHDWLADQGLTWRCQYSFDVPSGTHHYVGLTTSDSPVWICRRSFSTEGTDTTYTLYRETSFTDGTDIPLGNRNEIYRTATYKKPITTLKGGVTATPQAQDIMGSLQLTTAGQLEAEIGDDTGFIIKIKANTNYVLDIFNANGASRICKFAADFSRIDFIA